MTEDPSQIINFIPPGKLRCIVTGKLRTDRPEEHVRQRIARSLIEDYGYSQEDLEVEFRIRIGSSRRALDLVIFPPGVHHRQENLSIVVECKRETIKPTDRDNGIDQLHSYMSACLNCQFGMWVGSELQVWERVDSGDGLHEFLSATDIPRFGSDAPTPPHFSDLVPAHDELITVFKRCHNYIYGNEGIQKEPAFQEFLKIIFCKVYDEDNLVDQLKFFIGNSERRSDVGRRHLRNAITQLFQSVKERYPYIFEEDAQIQLNDSVLAYIVGELQRFSLIQTQADVKGVAYEQLVGSNLRGDRGEYFTPRSVCDMAARMLLATFSTSRLLDIRVVDPAVGTGGFLVSLMNLWQEHIYQIELNRFNEDVDRAIDGTKRRLQDIASRNLFGIDFNPVLVRAAQMNLVMHGDGSTNVFQANSLNPFGEWPNQPPNDARSNVRPNSFDAILTNPPFGSNIRIDDPHILEQFELSRIDDDGELTLGRAAMPPEQLFIERCLQLLRPGGRMAIVLPDSILSNPGLAFIRRWLLKRARLIASIDLPDTTFQPYTGTQTSVLLLQKKTRREIALEIEMDQLRNYEVFMATPEAVGHDRRGNVLYLRTPSGDLIEHKENVSIYRQDADGRNTIEWRENISRMVHNELPEVARHFEEWVSEPAKRAWINNA